MTTGISSASAYDKLASLTNSYNHAERLAHDWLKVSRAIRDLVADLSLNEPADSEMIARLIEFKQFVMVERSTCADGATELGRQMIDLNERIQNGVYNG